MTGAGTSRETGPAASLGIAAVEALREALVPARELGLDTGPAERLLAEAAERLGLAADVYVAALVGGTGVGKSSLLNALAGAAVSPAGPRRPTTGAPVAWVPEASAERIAPLLDRLGAGTPRLHRAEGLERVVVLDLPDVDSLEVAHRAAVEAILPHVDVVAWVTDPEKYADAVLHDGFLRRWLPRLDRQIVVLNKTDRLSGDGASRVVPDLEGLIAAELPPSTGAGGPKGDRPDPRSHGRAHDGARVPPVIVTSAVAGPSGVEALRRWLAEAADAKAVVAGRLAAAARAELADLATASGVEAGYQPLLANADRDHAVERAVQEVLRVVDLRGAEARAVGVTRSEARRRGTGPAGLLTSVVYRLAGRGGAAAGPGEHLRTWRGRGGLTSAAEAIRAAVLTALAALPAGLRGRYAMAGAEDLERRLGIGVDRAIGRHADQPPPTSRWWPFFGLVQSANQLAIAGVAAWLVVWFVVRPDLPDVTLPILGPLPAPVVLLGVALLVGYLLARLLSLHAGWLGRRWGMRLSDAIRREVGAVVAETAFAGVDRLEAARAAIAATRERAERDRRPANGARPGRIRRALDAAMH